MDLINHEVLLDFSLGRITDLDVMDILGLDSEEDLFLLMAKHDFSMPKLATADTQKMVNQLNNIMKIY